jgi:hypothetical protein
MTVALPETIKHGKHTLKLLRDSGSGKILVRNLQQYSRFREHMEGQGYIVSFKKIMTGQYAVYISTTVVPRSERELNVGKMHGKMAGVPSISTNPAMNSFCQKSSRSKCNDAICTHCYSYKNMVEGKSGISPQATSRPALTRNTRLLTNRPLENVPKTSAKFFRLSAEGDLHNEQHFLNFIAIAKANPNTHFTLWTKRDDIVQAALAKHAKPRNLHLIKSSFRMNHPDPKPPHFEKVFTVYTKEYVAEHKIKINCGAKSCTSCKLCYSNNNVHTVNELLKPGSHKMGKTP